MKNKQKSEEENQHFPEKNENGKWISRLFLLFSVGLLLYVSFLCYPTWPSSMKKAIEDPQNTSVYQIFTDFSGRLRDGDGVLSAFSQTYRTFAAREASD